MSDRIARTIRAAPARRRRPGPSGPRALAAAALLLAALAAPLRAEPPVAPTARPAETGGLLYFVHCARCHGADGAGGGPDAGLFASRPPDLRGERLAGARTRDWVAKVRDGRPPPLELRPGAVARRARDTEALLAHVRRLPEVSWADADAGREVFLERCAACHGWRGTPEPPLPRGVQGVPRDLAAPGFQSSVSDRRLRVLVRHGGERMPGLVPRLTEAEAEKAAAFVRLLSPGYALYDRLCATCHGNHGEGALGALQDAGTPAPAFDERFFRTRDDEAIRGSIWHMLEKAERRMPHFSETLDAARIETILAYLRGLPAAKATRAR